MVTVVVSLSGVIDSTVLMGGAAELCVSVQVTLLSGVAVVGEGVNVEFSSE